jgi:hypothetical protein
MTRFCNSIKGVRIQRINRRRINYSNIKNSSYAAIFTEDSIEENKSVIILANGMTIDELNTEKRKIIDRAVVNARQI